MIIKVALSVQIGQVKTGVMLIIGSVLLSSSVVPKKAIRKKYKIKLFFLNNDIF